MADALDLSHAQPQIRALARAIGWERRQVVEALQAQASIPEVPRQPVPRRPAPVIEPMKRPHMPVPKPQPVRSPSYLAAVRTLPCKRCGVSGFSQAAHPNEGKGMGTKADDNRAFALCGFRPGIPGCHHEHDQGGNVSRDERRALERTWGRQTFEQLQREGRVPTGMPTPRWEV